MMTKNIALLLGLLLMLSGVLGFAFPEAFGMHFTVTADLFYLMSGILALFSGTIGSVLAARTFCSIFGSIYGVFGLAGLLGRGADHLITIIPNQLIFGTKDHILHLTVAAVLLMAGLYAKYEDQLFQHLESVFPRTWHQ